MCDESHHVVIYVNAVGFDEQKVELDLIPNAHIPHSTPDEEVPAVIVTDVTDNGHSHMEGMH